MSRVAIFLGLAVGALLYAAIRSGNYEAAAQTIWDQAFFFIVLHALEERA